MGQWDQTPEALGNRAAAPQSISTRAFAAAVAIARAETLAELDIKALEGAGQLGFTSVLLAEVKNGRFKFLAGNPPEDWMNYLLKSGHMHEDVVFRATLEQLTPFFWTDFTDRPGLTVVQRQIIADRERFGFREGFTSTLRHRDGRVTFVTLSGFDVNSRDPEVRAAARVLADCYGLAARRLTSADRPLQVALTARQIDCLTWARAGKSTTDIGDILGISAHTVQEHITDACLRLGVRTRVQAVAEAMSMNLIRP